MLPGRLGLERVLDIRGFVYADWAGYLDQIISISGYVFTLFGGVVSWISKIQSIVALSTIEHGSHSCKEGSSLVADIVFKYGVWTTSYKDRL